MGEGSGHVAAGHVAALNRDYSIVVLFSEFF